MNALRILAVLALLPPGADSKRVAVIGGGIGGASFSLYYSKLHPDSEITLFEASDSIGGRLKHTTLHGHIIELGGDAWSTAANAYVVALAKEFRGAPATAATAASTSTTTATTAATAAAAATTTTASSTASSTSSSIAAAAAASTAAATATTTVVPARRRVRARERRRLDPLNLRVGVVRRRPPSSASSPASTLTSAGTFAPSGTSAPSGSSGSSGSVTNLETLLLEHPIADLTGAASETGFLRKLRMNYATRGANGTFESVAAFVATGGLDKYTSLSASAYWSAKHLSQEVADLFVEVGMGRVWGCVCVCLMGLSVSVHVCE